MSNPNAVTLARDIAETLDKLGLDRDQRERASREISESIAVEFDYDSEETLEDILRGLIQ